MKNLKIDFTFGTVVLAAIMIVCGDFTITLPLFSAALIHEIGHITAILMFRGQVRSIILNAGGFKINYDSSEFSYFQDVICALAGPVSGAAAAYIASMFGFTVFSGVSFSISLFNLLPVRPLDGGRILWSCLMMVAGEKAEIICMIIEIIVLCCLVVFSGYAAIITKGNLMLGFITAVLIFSYCKEK